MRAALATSDTLSPLFETLRRLLAAKPDRRKAVFTLLDEPERAAVDASSLVEGVGEALPKLAEASDLGLVTMQGRKACRAILRKFGLAKYFSVVITREDSLERPAQLRIAIGRLGAGREKVLFIGDRLNDVRSAKEVGVRVALISDRNEAGLEPDHRFQSFKELKHLLLDARR